MKITIKPAFRENLFWNFFQASWPSNAQETAYIDGDADAERFISAVHRDSRMVRLGGGFKYFLFSPLSGEMIQFDEHTFQTGWFNHQLIR